MKKRVVLYARVSGDDRKTATSSIESQLDECRKYAQGKRYNVVCELYEDPNRPTSGADYLPELDKALDMAQTGMFDILIIRELDRFARKLAKQLVMEDLFNQAGVTVEYTQAEYADTLEGQLNKQLRAVIADYEKGKITERMTRGKRNSVRSGNTLVQGRGAPYGYRLVQDNGRRWLEIDEDAAAVVRMIYDWYLGDDRPGQVAVTRRLNELSIKPPTAGKQWSRSTVHHILRNETYAGTWHYGKTGNGRDHWIPVEVPAIIDKETWKRARERAKTNYSLAPRNMKYEYLLQGLCVCGGCGTPMRTQQNSWEHRYYGCPIHKSTKDKYAKTCNQRKYFRAGVVDAAVWQAIKTFIINPETFRRGLEDYQRELAENNAPFENRLEVINRLITENRTRLNNLLDLYLDGRFDKEALLERKTRLERVLSELENERSKISGELEGTLSNEDIEYLQWVATNARKALELADNSFEARRGIIERMGTNVVLTVEQGRQVAHVRCNIGPEMLLIVDKNKDGSVMAHPG